MESKSECRWPLSPGPLRQGERTRRWAAAAAAAAVTAISQLRVTIKLHRKRTTGGYCFSMGTASTSSSAQSVGKNEVKLKVYYAIRRENSWDTYNSFVAFFSYRRDRT